MNKRIKELFDLYDSVVEKREDKAKVFNLRDLNRHLVKSPNARPKVKTNFLKELNIHLIDKDW